MARSSPKRIMGTLLFAAALVAIMAFLFLVFADAENLDDVPGVGDMDPVAIAFAIAMGVIALLLLLLLIIRSYDKKEEDADAAEVFFVPEEDKQEIAAANEAAFDAAFGQAPELTVYDIWRVKPQKNAWSTGAQQAYHFPRNVEAGVYANDYIEVSPGHHLKLRTLLAGPANIPMRSGGRAVVSHAEPEVHDTPEDLAAPAEEIESPGDDFMAELDARYREMKDTGDFDNFESLETPEADEVYYGYQGDIDPVTDIEGIGPVFAEKLAQLGIETTARLCYEDADELAQRLGTDAKRVRTWQSMAELMKVSGIGGQYAEALARAGIEGIGELKRRSANAIAEQVNGYLDSLETNVLGSKITARRIEGWQSAAKEMRRVRSKVPAS